MEKNLDKVAASMVQLAWTNAGGLENALQRGSFEIVFNELAATVLPGLDTPVRQALVRELLALRRQLDPNFDHSWRPQEYRDNQIERDGVSVPADSLSRANIGQYQPVMTCLLAPDS